MRGPYRRRRIDRPPRWTRFKPAGVPRRGLARTILSVDEYEAIRLADYVGFEHQEASEHMGISRPTFSRLIEKARHKVAESLVEGRELIISGGNFAFASTLLHCQDCGDVMPAPVESELTACPECNSEEIEDLAHRVYPNRTQRRRRARGGKNNVNRSTSSRE